MPKEREDFRAAVDAVLDVVMFENWLRFYFITEDKENSAGDDAGGELKIELPEKTVKKIEELYPDFAPLAKNLNGRAITFDISRNAVQNYALEYLDKRNMPKDMAKTVFTSQTLQVKLALFHTWESLHEDQLDRGFLDFGSWKKLFAEWREGAGGRAAEEKLAETIK